MSGPGTNPQEQICAAWGASSTSLSHRVAGYCTLPCTSLTLKQAQCELSRTQGCNIFLTLLTLQLAMRKGVVAGVSSGIQDFWLHEPQPGPCVHLLHLNPLWVPCLFYSPHRFQYSASDFKRLKMSEETREMHWDRKWNVKTKLGVQEVLAFDFHQVQIFMQPIQQVRKKLLNFTGEWLHETGECKKNMSCTELLCCYRCYLSSFCFFGTSLGTRMMKWFLQNKFSQSLKIDTWSVLGILLVCISKQMPSKPSNKMQWTSRQHG